MWYLYRSILALLPFLNIRFQTEAYKDRRIWRHFQVPGLPEQRIFHHLLLISWSCLSFYLCSDQDFWLLGFGLQSQRWYYQNSKLWGKNRKQKPQSIVCRIQLIAASLWCSHSDIQEKQRKSINLSHNSCYFELICVLLPNSHPVLRALNVDFIIDINLMALP